VAFSTNLDPGQLADEAFLRRIPNKIRTDYAAPEQFIEIFRRECLSRSLNYDLAVAEHAVEFITRDCKRHLVQCYAKDLINQIVWEACYSAREATLSNEAIERACRSYFMRAPAKLISMA
jgi:hypothetical protein